MKKQYSLGLAVAGTNNLWIGGGAAPAFLSGHGSADPKFVDIASRDFRLRAGSPAIDARVGTGVSRDYVGIFRWPGSYSYVVSFPVIGGTRTNSQRGE